MGWESGTQTVHTVNTFFNLFLGACKSAPRLFWINKYSTFCVCKGFNAHSIYREFFKADLSPLLPLPPKNHFQINTNLLFPVHKYIHQLIRAFSSSYPFNVCLDIWKVCLAGEGAKKERSSLIVQCDFVPCSVCQTAEKLSPSSSYVRCWRISRWQWTAQQPPEW